MNEIRYYFNPLRSAGYALLTGVLLLFVFFVSLLARHKDIFDNGILSLSGGLGTAFVVTSGIFLMMFKQNTLLSRCNAKLAAGRFATSLLAPDHLKQITAPEAVLECLLGAMTLEYHETKRLLSEPRQFGDPAYVYEFAYVPFLQNLDIETKAKLRDIVLKRISDFRVEFSEALKETPLSKRDPAGMKTLSEMTATLAYHTWVLESINYPDFEMGLLEPPTS